MVTTPFGRGSIALGLYLHDGPPEAAVERLVAQAAGVERAGFDGATIAEHHAGFRGYLPNPLLAASWMLAGTRHIWSGPCPLLLPVRHAALVAEDLAWLDARFPGRVVAGFAAGYHEDDFVALGRDDFRDRGRVHGARLLEVATALRGDGGGLLGNDAAMAGGRTRDLPLAGAAGSAPAAVRAAAAGVGLLLDSMAPPEALGRLASAYEEAGGVGPRVLGRRIWVGEPPVERFASQLAAYRTQPAADSFMRSATTDALIGGPAGLVVERVLEAAGAAGATVLLLRVHLPGVSPEEAEDQIGRLGDEVLPALRASFGAPATDT